MARRASEKRQRNYRLTVRFNDQEQKALQSMADHAGISPTALARSKLFNSPPDRAARRPTANQKAVVQLLAHVAKLTGAINKIGANINQAQKHMNAGHPQWNVWEEAVREYTQTSERVMPEIRTAIMQALGREQERKGKTDEA